MTQETDRIEAAFATTDRRGFLPRGQRGLADQDRALFIGHGQTSSQPTLVRTMLRLLEPRPGEHILDVGSGSGWTTALLGRLVTSTGRVYGVELVPELVEWGAANLAAQDMAWTRIAQADPDRLGLPELAPYDKILVSAEARHLPDALVDQLASPGRLVIPVAGRLSVLDRAEDGGVEERRIGHCTFVPLR